MPGGKVIGQVERKKHEKKQLSDTWEFFQVTCIQMDTADTMGFHMFAYGNRVKMPGGRPIGQVERKKHVKKQLLLFFNSRVSKWIHWAFIYP